MQPLTTMPAGPLMQMGSWSTHLQGAQPPEDNSSFMGGLPLYLENSEY